MNIKTIIDEIKPRLLREFKGWDIKIKDNNWFLYYDNEEKISGIINKYMVSAVFSYIGRINKKVYENRQPYKYGTK